MESEPAYLSVSSGREQLKVTCLHDFISFKVIFFLCSHKMDSPSLLLIVNDLSTLAGLNSQCFSDRVYLMVMHGFCFHSNICIYY